MRPYLGKIVALSALSALLLVSGCREDLYSGLSEADANELTAVLLERNIAAHKEAAGKNGFTVTVPEEDFVNAITIAKDHALPRNQFASLGSIFSGQSMISSQVEERSRLSYAISQELSATLERIDGVLDARVHVVLSEFDQMSGQTIKPSASVFVRHTHDSPVSTMLVGIKETVARAVPGLDISAVSVMTEAYTPNVALPPARPQSNLWQWGLAGLGLLLIIAGGSGILAYRKGYRLTLQRQDLKQNQDK